jgi:thioester reductase-like protein
MNVLLTGSTGFVGGEVLVRLAKRSDLEKIFCLIRARSAEDGMLRLKKVFSVHDDFFPEDKIIPVVLDLTDKDFANKIVTTPGISSVNIIIHSAANTSFAKIFDDVVEKINITGLKNILTWAQSLKSLNLFTYIGTATICGKGIKNSIISEDESPNMNAKHVVKYTYSKMMGEFTLKEYLPDDKLLVVRPSIIMGDSTYSTPRSNVILWTLATCNFLRLVPVKPESKLDIIPIDFAADSIVALVFAPNRTHSVYHISSGIAGATTPIQLTDAITPHFKKGLPFSFVDISLLGEMKHWARKRLNESSKLLQYTKYLDCWEKAFNYDRSKLRILFAGLEPYLYFMGLGHIFDNSRALKDTTVGQSVPAHKYITKCIGFIKNIDIFAGALNP